MQNGLAIIHSNHLETLAEAAFAWCQRQPLAPLENELFLVQSNGMADWLKLKMAQFQGISAAVEYPMPSSFIWRLYRSVLSDDLALHSPYDKGSLQWRIYQLLPELIKRDEFERPRQFLLTADGKLNTLKCFQLSHKLADLFDQYQQYRGDWLLDWQANKNCFLQDKSPAFAQDEAWQKQLWQHIVEQISAEHLSRATLHQAFKQALANHKDKLPRRIIVFGVNSLSEQVFDALCALAPYTQLLMLVLNPSEVFWQLRSKDTPINHPLLDSWGARGRDFTLLLDEKNEALPENLQQVIQQAYVYLGQQDSGVTRPDSVLFALQQAMQNNQPISEIDKLPLPSNPGLAFFPCYSRQREVEILHDQLLALFDAQVGLNYHDVIVMVPNIEHYVAHIEAVFGRYPQSDSRYLHYSISDRNNLTDNPLFSALDYLLALPEKRLLQSEVFYLLEQAAIRQAFQLSLDDVEQLKQWVAQSNIRWGLDEQHKADVLAHQTLEQWRNNTWQQGLDRLLAGYCGGSALLWGDDDNTPLCDGIAIDEVSANQGVVLGQFVVFIEKLKQLRQQLMRDYAVFGERQSWQTIFESLLTTFFNAEDSFEQDMLVMLEKALMAWRDDVALAENNPVLPLNIARQAWLEKIQSTGQSQRLSFNGIMFCTLMPMRALPFKHVYLLGMNDGDYPREQIAPDFDLMQYAFKTGDRDRRVDDQYLFLEALLSVRDSLTISWVGKDITDSSVREPSTLVSQLRDYIDLVYQGSDEKKASQLLTQEYPLASFSKAYFVKHKPDFLSTYANEWWHLHQPKLDAAALASDLAITLDSISLTQLAQLFNKASSIFFREGLGVRYYEEEALQDDEPFAIDGLQQWQIRNAVLQQQAINVQSLKRSGEIPAGFYADGTVQQSIDDAQRIQQRFLEVLGDSAQVLDEWHYQFVLGQQDVTLQGVLSSLWQTPTRTLQVHKTASNITKDGWRYDKLANLWLCHLVACASGLAVESTLVSLSKTAKFRTLTSTEALGLLHKLVDIYHEALQKPLPLTLHAATAYLKAQQKAWDTEQAAKDAFHNGYNRQGDESDAYVAAAFASFDDVWRGDGYEFAALVEAVYLPMHEHIIDFDKGKHDDE